VSRAGSDDHAVWLRSKGRNELLGPLHGHGSREHAWMGDDAKEPTQNEIADPVGGV
jgi:hypothetical protein